MGTARRQKPALKMPVWARLAAAPVVAIGSFCLIYHFFFWFFWRFLFGEEVWPWPQWSLWVLVIIPGICAIAAAVFLCAVRATKRNTWIAVGVGALSLFGLIRYAAEVWKVMFQLGFKP
jgi:hypothetical protein